MSGFGPQDLVAYGVFFYCTTAGELLNVIEMSPSTTATRHIALLSQYLHITYTAVVFTREAMA